MEREILKQWDIESGEENSFSKKESEVFSSYMESAIKECASDECFLYKAGDYFSKYNEARHKEINKKKRQHLKVLDNDIAVATQFFTPKAIAEYLTAHTLEKVLSSVEEEEKDTEKAIEKIKKIRIFDPAVGAGALLYSAMNVLIKAYLRVGADEKEAKENAAQNLVGFDIDERAVKVAERLFYESFGIEKKFLYPPDINCETKEYLKECGKEELFKKIDKLKVLGSLIHFSKEEGQEIFAGKFFSEAMGKENSERLQAVISAIQSKYDIVLMNPPYLSSSDFSPTLKEYINRNYYNYRQDLFSSFISRGIEWLKKDGLLGVVCPYNWMFIKQFEALREKILKKTTVTNLVMLPFDGYNKAVVFLSAFVVSKRNRENTEGEFIKVLSKKFVNENFSVGNMVVRISQERFNKTPNKAFIFWTSENFINNYKYPRLSEYMDIRQGMATGNNKKHLKLLSEVDKEEVCFNAEDIDTFNASKKMYALYSKGGEYRKWYGNYDYVIRFDKENQEVLSKSGNRMPSKKFYFKKGITWTLVSTKGHFGARLMENSVFDVGGSAGFPRDEKNLNIILAFLCSNVASYYLNAHNPTLNCQVGDIKNLPFIEPQGKDREVVEKCAAENILLSKKDWEENFSSPKELERAFQKIKENEEEINKIFVRLYSLEKEVDFRVEDRLITLRSKLSSS